MQLVLLTAPWCQWCRLFEHEVLSDPEVVALLAPLNKSVADVDVKPTWMDVAGFGGLPTLVFYDEQGRQLLTRSGYRSAAELSDLVNAVETERKAGRLKPYADQGQPLRLTSEGISAEAAQQTLTRLEQALFFEVNSNDGGFRTPARHPYPRVLLELEVLTRDQPEHRARKWIELTIRGALRGSSPRLAGEPLPDLAYAANELRSFSKGGPAHGKQWRGSIEKLPTQDPYRGLQDPVDHGVFRYAAGPGWYHPHFERQALDNMAWAQLLALRGETARADEIRNFVFETFASSPSTKLVAASQRSNPYYYRLTAEERLGVPTPKVQPLYRLDVQAQAALLDPERCPTLLRTTTSWPRQLWTTQGAEDLESGRATSDAVGTLLQALASCEGPQYQAHAKAVAQNVAKKWAGEGLDASPRLFRLAAGMCAVDTKLCERALEMTRELPLSLDHPPPLRQLHELATR